MEFETARRCSSKSLVFILEENSKIFVSEMESTMKKLKENLRSWSSGEKKEEDMKESWFLYNGSVFLKELIADCNGKSIPIRSFSSSQIIQATDNFDISCFVTHAGFHMWWYRGIIEDRSYMIKRFSEEIVPDYGVKEVYNDVVLSARSRMSNHRNFLKLLGCCLEFPFLVLVFEYAEHGVLNHRGAIKVNKEEALLPWSVRLKIGKEIANALTYLHMAFPKIIIHRDVKPVRIFLDKNWNAKLSNLSFSVSLPEGKTRIETERVMGTVGYLDPSYIATNFVTEYTDVYSFGVFLMVLLTARPALVSAGSDGEYKGIISYVKGLYENGKLDEVIDPMMFKDNTNGQRFQVEACVVLAMRCCEEKDEDRPKMIQVAKELKRIEASVRDSLISQV